MIDPTERSSRTRLPLRLARALFDRDYLQTVLAVAEGDIRRAAEIAEIHPKSFERLLRRYQLSRTAADSDS